MPTSVASSFDREAHSEPLEARLTLFAQSRTLGAWLVAVGLGLATPSVFIGFHLDDYFGRYIHSSLPGARELYDMQGGGFGLADGNPSHNHWQIETGHAPWWTYDKLRLILFRPISLLTHELDARLWPNSAFAMHLHSLVWLALLLWLVTRLYRELLGPLVGGMAALLFALDHTHGFEVGFISNRHALVTGVFAVLCLHQLWRFREHGSRSAGLWSVLLYVLALLSGEFAVSVFGYVLAYALFVDRAAWWKRVLYCAPYVAITVLWRVAYNLGGYGGEGSGLYVDPVREPWLFLRDFLERVPILGVSQFFLPPADLYIEMPRLVVRLVFLYALPCCALIGLAFSPIVRRDRMARFWALGFAISLVPASATYPHGRQLLLASLGAFGLLAQLWHRYSVELRNVALSSLAKLQGSCGALMFGTHLFISPLATPIATCSLVLAAPLERVADEVGPEIEGKDVVFVGSPDYFAVRLFQARKRVEHQALPRRIRALAFGEERIVVHRTANNVLELEYPGGILATQALELFRDKRLRMTVGQRVTLQGLQVEVLSVTGQGMPDRARFTFDANLDSPQFVFYTWQHNRYEPFSLPQVAGSVSPPPAVYHLGF